MEFNCAGPCDGETGQCRKCGALPRYAAIPRGFTARSFIKRFKFAESRNDVADRIRDNAPHRVTFVASHSLGWMF